MQLESALRGRYDLTLFTLHRGGESMATAARDGPLAVSPGVAPGGLVRAGLALRGRVRAFRPDVVVAHGGDPLRAAVLAGLHRIAPLVCLRVSSVPSELRTPVRLRTLDFAYRRVAAFVAVSESLRRELIEDFGIPPARVRVIRNGRRILPPLTDDERSAIRRELGIAADEPMVAWMGRLVPEKDPLAAVALAARLDSLMPAARVVLIGDGPMKARVLADATRTPRLVLPGTRADGPRLVAAADLLVSTSRTEGAPGVLVEALVAGVPVVATDVGGVRDVVEPGESGLLTSPGDPEALPAAVAGLLGDDAERTRMSARARVSGERFDIARVSDEYDALYQQLLARRPRA